MESLQTSKIFKALLSVATFGIKLISKNRFAQEKIGNKNIFGDKKLYV